jgi:exonuclease SbcD
MAESIRVLHFADTHIGMENYGKTDPETGLSSRVVDFLRRMDEVVNYAREEAVDLVIFAGDAFKTRAPNPTFQREFAWRVRDLAEIAPVVLLVGNHDLPPTALKASSIEIYDTLAVPNVWVAGDYEVREVETKGGPVIIGTAPYPITPVTAGRDRWHDGGGNRRPLAAATHRYSRRPGPGSRQDRRSG